jgi:Tol biopolymer transport system component
MWFQNPPKVGSEGFFWSPDGNHMYYRSIVSGTVYERSGDQERVVVAGNEALKGLSGNETDWNCPISLSPDGRWISMFRTDATSTSLILTLVPTAGGAPREIFRAAKPRDSYYNSSTGPQWTPDGKALVVETMKGPQNNELWFVPIDDGPSHKLDFDPGRRNTFTLNPGGRHLAYVVGHDKPEMWVVENLLTAIK